MKTNRYRFDVTLLSLQSNTTKEHSQGNHTEPYPLALVINLYSPGPTSADDAILIPRDRVPIIPIPMKPKTKDEKTNPNER